MAGHRINLNNGFQNAITVPVRADIMNAQSYAWAKIGAAGTLWTGAERVAIAAEARHALTCPLCANRRQVLSPSTVGGDHATLDELPASAIEAIHRIRTDSGRIGENWVRGLVSDGLDQERYVELISVVVAVVAIDTFRFAVGLDPLPLPSVRSDQPSRRRPAGAKDNLAWVSTVAPEDVGPVDPDLYHTRPGVLRRSGANIQRALSLVPDAMMHWWDMFETLYMPGPWMRDFTREYREVSHAQMEMLAARVSALNQCTY
jgi:hypothetical protein